MNVAARIVLYAGRTFGLLQIVLGLLLWTGFGAAWLGLHMLNGILITLLLFAAAWFGVRAGASKGLVWFGVAWAVLLPVFGIMHPTLLAGALHWIIQVLHLVVGIVALGLIDRLAGAGRARRSRSVGRVTGV